jgi:hypothetical protein
MEADEAGRGHREKLPKRFSFPPGTGNGFRSSYGKKKKTSTTTQQVEGLTDVVSAMSAEERQLNGLSSEDEGHLTVLPSDDNSGDDVDLEHSALSWSSDDEAYSGATLLPNPHAAGVSGGDVQELPEARTTATAAEEKKSEGLYKSLNFVQMMVAKCVTIGVWLDGNKRMDLQSDARHMGCTKRQIFGKIAAFLSKNVDQCAELAANAESYRKNVCNPIRKMSCS